MFDGKVPSPVDLNGSACLHTSPNVRKLDNGKYEALCVGTTTSSRMDRFTPGLMHEYGVRAMIGSWFGSKLITKLSDSQFVIIVNVLIFIAGLILIFK